MILAASQNPAPSGGPDPDLVTPGTVGFLVTLAIVIVVIFLIRDALRRVRRVRARSGSSDAYPIPLRRHVVPNQSKLSGPEAPADAGEESVADDGDSSQDDSGSQDARESGEDRPSGPPAE